MTPSAELTVFEQQTLLAALRLRSSGYGIAIRDEIARITGRSPAIGTVYAALDRLAEKEFLSTRKGEPTQERGGRRKLYFIVTPKGRAALQRTLRSLDALRAGTTLAGVLS
jgi:PadR family transcriptional regulator, regulatory protein PadR